MAKLGLCIGINDYPGTGSDLSGCVNDAKDWKHVLESRGFDVDILLDNKATKAGMVKAMLKIVRKAQAGDVVVIQYSGHGSWVPDADGDERDERDETLCPYDVAHNRPLTDDELLEIFSERERGVRIVFLSDSCHSGTVSKFRSIVGTPAKSSRVRYLPPASFLPKSVSSAIAAPSLPRASSPPGRSSALLLAGCQETEFSYDAFFNDRPNGAFTRAALQALKKLPVSATYRDWHREIRKSLPTSQHPQTPNIYGTYRQRRWKLFEEGKAAKAKALNGGSRKGRRAQAAYV